MMHTIPAPHSAFVEQWVQNHSRMPPTKSSRSTRAPRAPHQAVAGSSSATATASSARGKSSPKGRAKTAGIESIDDWLDHLHIRNLRVGNSRVGLDFTRRGERTFCNVVDVEGDKLAVNVAFRK